MNFAPDLANSCSAFLTFCSIFIGVTIILLFLGETSDLEILKISSIGFLTGVVCFLLALVCFWPKRCSPPSCLNLQSCPSTHAFKSTSRA